MKFSTEEKNDARVFLSSDAWKVIQRLMDDIEQKFGEAVLRYEGDQAQIDSLNIFKLKSRYNGVQAGFHALRERFTNIEREK